jgi:hypothetical protein
LQSIPDAFGGIDDEQGYEDRDTKGFGYSIEGDIFMANKL